MAARIGTLMAAWLNSVFVCVREKALYCFGSFMDIWVVSVFSYCEYGGVNTCVYVFPSCMAGAHWCILKTVELLHPL